MITFKLIYANLGNRLSGSLESCFVIKALESIVKKEIEFLVLQAFCFMRKSHFSELVIFL